MPRSRPPAPQASLEEVERAISALEGRHPEHERTRRETLAAAQARGVALEKEAAVRARQRRHRAVVVVTNAAAVIAVGVVGWRLAVRTGAIRAALATAEAPWVSRGYAVLTSNALTARRTLEVDVPGASCFVAIATGDATVLAREGATSVQAKGSVGWCACSPGHTNLEASTAGGADIGVALLRIDAQATGGALGRPWVDLAPGAWGEGGDECADAALDGWIADGRAPRPFLEPLPLEDRWFAADKRRAALRRQGFRVMGSVAPERPFGAVAGNAGDCMLAVGAAGESLSLRATGGARLVAHEAGALAWCDSRATTATVWHDGGGRVVVLAAPAARVGGLLGVRECADAAGFPVAPEAAWLRDEDLAWEAEVVLQASGLAGVKSGGLPGEPGAADGAITALVSSRSGRVAAMPTSVAVACDPTPYSGTALHESVCATPAPVAWWRTGDGAASAARAPVPFWLSALEPHHEADAIARVPELLTLARRLGRDGFEPTMLEGVTELPDGVRVVGRAAEDAVVAVGVAPRQPWVFPYTDRVPWDLGDAPRVIALQPGASVKLVSIPPSDSPLEKRRTIVFRRAAHP
jgi:hypothetical protein